MQVPGTVELPKVEPVVASVSAPVTGVAELPKVEPVATTAPAVGATLQPAPTIEPVAKPKDYEAMIEQALAEPLPVETAASAAGLLRTPVGVPAASATTPVAPAVGGSGSEYDNASGSGGRGAGGGESGSDGGAAGGGRNGGANFGTDGTRAISELGAQPGAMPPVGVMEAKPGQIILPPAPTPEVGTGLMPPKA